MARTEPDYEQIMTEQMGVSRPTLNDQFMDMLSMITMGGMGSVIPKIAKAEAIKKLSNSIGSRLIFHKSKEGAREFSAVAEKAIKKIPEKEYSHIKDIAWSEGFSGSRVHGTYAPVIKKIELNPSAGKRLSETIPHEMTHSRQFALPEAGNFFTTKEDKINYLLLRIQQQHEIPYWQRPTEIQARNMGEIMKVMPFKKVPKPAYDTFYRMTQKHAEDITRKAYPSSYTEELSNLNKFLEEIGSEILK